MLAPPPLGCKPSPHPTHPRVWAHPGRRVVRTLGMTASPAAAPSRAWHWTWRGLYRLLRLLDPVLRLAWRGSALGLDRSVDIVVPGRRTGRERRVLVTLLSVDGRAYVGHPNGAAPWTRNVEAAGTVELGHADGRRDRARAVRLAAGPERDAVIRATWDQQPVPGNVIYALARRHVRAVGVYFRLETDRPGSPDAAAPPAELPIRPGTGAEHGACTS